MNNNIPHHPLYQYSLSNPDAAAMAFLDPHSDPIIYPFQFKEFKETQIRVKVIYCGLCQSDCAKVRGTWKKQQVFPMVPGHEPIGIVSKIGEKVSKFKIGDVVVAAPIKGCCQICLDCKRGNSNLCPKRISFFNPEFGAFSTHFQIEESMVYKIPKDFDIKRGSPLMCAGITVFAPLKRYGKSGKKCAIISIGGLGHLALQMANKMGMEVTAFSSRQNIKDELKSLGAKYIKNSSDKQILEQEQGKYDLVLSNSFTDNEEMYQLYIKLTNVGGTFVQVGIPRAGIELKLDMRYIVMNGIRVTGSIIGNQNEVQEMLDFCSNYSVYPIIEEFDFADFKEVFERGENKTAKYRYVVNIERWSKENGYWNI